MNACKKTPRARFTQQKRRAAGRGIGWELTFEQWMTIWRDSGHWNERGLGCGQYVMARIGDVGPYSQSNVVIALSAKNISDATISLVGSGRGWTINKRSKKNPYQVVLGDTYIGLFPTQELAEKAYSQAAEARKNFRLSKVLNASQHACEVLGE